MAAAQNKIFNYLITAATEEIKLLSRNLCSENWLAANSLL